MAMAVSALTAFKGKVVAPKSKGCGPQAPKGDVKQRKISPKPTQVGCKMAAQMAGRGMIAGATAGVAMGAGKTTPITIVTIAADEKTGLYVSKDGSGKRKGRSPRI